MDGSHENLKRDEELRPGSNRGFGLTMGVVFAIVTGIALWAGATGWAALWAGLAVAFAGLALAAPALLDRLNLAWFRFGLLLHRIVSPVVMVLLFFGVILPIGLVMRLVGQRPLALAFDRDAKSYWLPRAERTPAAGSMRKQF